MKSLVFRIAGTVATLALLLTAAPPTMAQPTINPAIEKLSKQELARRIVTRWSSYVEDVYLANADDWALRMAPVFERASLEAMRKAAVSTRFKAMNDALLLGEEGRVLARQAIEAWKSGKGDGSTQVKALGDPSAELVFVPVTPCRIVDTRVAGGRIPTGTARDFDVTGTSTYVSQGGEPSNCGIGSAGSFAAAALNLTVVNPAGAGFITAYPRGVTRPLASNVNFVAGDIQANFAIVRLDQGPAADELSVYTSSETHLVIDVLGYFINPLQSLQCRDTSSDVISIPPNGNGSTETPACDPGYEITGGGCATGFNSRVVATRTYNFLGTHFCAFRNDGGVSANAQAHAVCCRLPSR